MAEFTQVQSGVLALTNGVYGNKLFFNIVNQLVSALLSTWMPAMSVQCLPLTSAQQESCMSDIIEYSSDLEL